MNKRNVIVSAIKYSFIYVLASLLATNIFIYLFKVDRTSMIIGNILAFFIPLIIGFCGSYKHLSQKQKIEILNRTLKRLTKYDFLTGIYNRRTFLGCFEQELSAPGSAATTLVFCIMDLDFFKLVNDNYGHLAGDVVLVETARVITSSLPETAYFGRFGGEEFCLLFPGITEAEAFRILDEIRQRLSEQHFPYKNDIIRITASFGLYCKKPDDTIDLKQIIHNADRALYLAKRNGRNRVESDTGEDAITQPPAGTKRLDF